MKRYALITTIMFVIVSCSSFSTEETDENTVESVNEESSIEISTTTVASPSQTIPEYQFDIDKMSPLTGKYISQEEWLLRPRRVISFKIDNNLNARPQSGLEKADLVYEVLVEGGMTRFLAVFLDSTSDYLGPIRSAHPTDPTLIKPFSSTLVVSGATEGLIPSIRELGVNVLEEQNSPTMFRIASRNAPHNLYADTELVRDVIDSKGYIFVQPGPPPIFEFGYDQTNWYINGSKITIKYSDQTTVIWKLDGTIYNRFIIDSYSNSNDPEAHNWISQDGFASEILTTESIVVIQGVQYRDEATTLPSILTVGLGPVYVFNNGQMVEGTWRRSDIDDPFELYDTYGEPIIIPPGKQWIHILPLEGSITVSN